MKLGFRVSGFRDFGVQLGCRVLGLGTWCEIRVFWFRCLGILVCN